MKKLFTLFCLIAVAMCANADDSMLSTPLTVEAIEAGTVHFNNKAEGPVSYTVNGGARQTIAAETLAKISVKAGDKLAFYGDNAAYYKYDEYAAPLLKHNVKRREAEDDEVYDDVIGSTSPFYVYGNIMSLVSSKNFASAKTLTGEYNFCEMFYGQENLRSHPSKAFVLPATTLTEGCYDNMFCGCTGLTTAPELPATTLAEECYYAMFMSCVGLTSAPTLPATTMKMNCYSHMFTGCSSLTSMPELPATTLARACYYCMFENCAGLKTASALPATKMEEWCYCEMFRGCAALTAPPALPATTLAENCYYSMFSESGLTEAPELPALKLEINCYSYMFKKCISLTQAPDLLAPTLVEGCYSNMFQLCNSLNYVKCLATYIPDEEYCTWNWLEYVAQNGTFVKAMDMQGWTRDGSGIPSSWRVEEEEGTTDPLFRPLTIEAIDEGCTVTFLNCAAKAVTCKKNDGSTVTFEPGTDGKVWIDAGASVSFYGDNDAYATDGEHISRISCSAPCYLYGNIMSLVSSTDFDSATELTTPYAFTGLFMNCGIRSHAKKPLLLPATTLSAGCYAGLFMGCMSLDKAPSLPATELTENCYGAMFYQCNSLTEAPELPATTLSPSCYASMFAYANGLVQAPELPATEMKESCYEGMFTGCTSLTTAPLLPAPVLAERCYLEMFKNCTRLNSVECLATDISAANCTEDWLSDVASSGTFTKAASMTGWHEGKSGIPMGWTVNDNYTGIKTIYELMNNDDALYDLNGRRVTNPVRGMYITKGKKVMMK